MSKEKEGGVKAGVCEVTRDLAKSDKNVSNYATGLAEKCHGFGRKAIGRAENATSLAKMPPVWQKILSSDLQKSLPREEQAC